MTPRLLAARAAASLVLTALMAAGPAAGPGQAQTPPDQQPPAGPGGGDLVGRPYDPCARLGKESPPHRLVPAPLKHATNGVFVEGEDYVCFPDGYPGVEPSGTVMIPLAALAENTFGFAVRWDAKARAVTLAGRGADGKERTVVVKPGSRTVTVNGARKTLDGAPTVYHEALQYCYVAALPECVRAGNKPLPGKVILDRLYVPVAFIPVAFGAEAKWDGWLVRIKR